MTPTEPTDPGSHSAARDPFADLRDPTTPVAPRPRFHRELREALADAQAAEASERSAEFRRRLVLGEARIRSRIEAPVEPAASERHERHVVVVPIGIDTRAARTIPYLCVADGAAALDFYARALDARVTMRVEGDDGTLGHAELRVGDVVVYVSEEFPDHGVRSPTSLGAASVTIVLEVESLVDDLFLRMVEAGADAVRLPADQPHGHRVAIVVDPFGHRWMLSQRIAEVSPEEYAARETGWRVRGEGDASSRPPSDPPF